MKKLYFMFVFLLFVGVVSLSTACSQGEDTPYDLLVPEDSEPAPTADEDCADNQFVTADCVDFELDQAEADAAADAAL